jgi:hypothetical protein
MFGGREQLWTDLIERAEPPQRFRLRLRARETGGDECVRARGEMEPDFVVGLGLDTASRAEGQP